MHIENMESGKIGLVVLPMKALQGSLGATESTCFWQQDALECWLSSAVKYPNWKELQNDATEAETELLLDKCIDVLYSGNSAKSM